jgi:hypothetical protein
VNVYASGVGPVTFGPTSMMTRIASFQLQRRHTYPGHHDHPRTMQHAQHCEEQGTESSAVSGSNMCQRCDTMSLVFILTGQRVLLAIGPMVRGPAFIFLATAHAIRSNLAQVGRGARLLVRDAPYSDHGMVYTLTCLRRIMGD